MHERVIFFSFENASNLKVKRPLRPTVATGAQLNFFWGRITLLSETY